MVGELICVQGRGRGKAEPSSLGPLAAARWTVYVPEGLSPRRLARRLLRAERGLAKLGAGRVVLRGGFPYGDRLRLLRPVDPLPLWRGLAAELIRQRRFQVRPMITAQERAGRAFVHYTAWREAYAGILDSRILDNHTMARCQEVAEKYPENTLVLTDRDKVVGFARYEPEARDFVTVPDAAEVSALYVLEAYQGQGLGRMLMDACLDRLERPRVGLLNIGSEEGKGDQLRQDAYQVLRAAGDAGNLNFIGNIEAKEAVKGGCDVVVADGFSGNVMLKTIEGVGSFMGRELKGMFLSSLKTKIAALLVKSGLDAFKERLDPDTIGGTPFLGLQKPVIKAHGSSKARAIENAVYQAAAGVKADLAGEIEAKIGLMKTER